MSYTLTLSAAERQAIDWVGGRYAHGDDLRNLLWVHSQCPVDLDWDDAAEITFSVPEWVAWQIAEIGSDCNYTWDCFADELSSKLTDFCLAIV